MSLVRRTVREGEHELREIQMPDNASCPENDIARIQLGLTPDYLDSNPFYAESKLYYYRARSYDPQLGRFLSEDPIGLAGGINPYVYAGNDPVNATDPYGLGPCTDSDDVEPCEIPGVMATAPKGGGGSNDDPAHQNPSGNDSEDPGGGSGSCPGCKKVADALYRFSLLMSWWSRRPRPTSHSPSAGPASGARPRTAAGRR